MRQWFGVSANAVLNMGWTQFINHANYKIIDSNLMDWANVTKIYTPLSAKRCFPAFLTNMRCTKTISLPGMASYRKWLLTSRPLLKIAAPLLFANRSTVKHATWSNSCRLWHTVLRAVCNASLLFLFFAIDCQSKARRALYFGISLASPNPC